MTIEAPFDWSQILPITKTRTVRAGSSGSDANFNLANNEFPLCQSIGLYIPLKFCCFENIFKISSNFLSPLVFDLRNTHPSRRILPQNKSGLSRKCNPDENQQENNVKDRNFVLFGVGLSYKPQNQIELYGNVSQNYRSVI
jgi:Fe(3+) dicitrate transport protein